MIVKTTVTINGEIYEKAPAKGENPVRIIILPQGWVFVGEVEEDGDDLVIRNAKVVRRWGTTGGLAELANKGPLDKTVLDGSVTFRTKTSSIIGQLDCDQGAWEGQ